MIKKIVDLEGVPAEAYPVEVFNVNEESLGFADNGAEYQALWNADPDNAAFGQITAYGGMKVMITLSHPTSVMPTFYAYGNTAFNTLLEFPSDTTDTAASVTGTVAAADTVQKFEFNAIAPPTGESQAMAIKVGGVQEILIDYYLSYGGKLFKYTDKTGVAHRGVFTNGTVTF